MQKTNIPLLEVGVEASLLAEAVDTIVEKEYDIDMIYQPIDRYLINWNGR